MVSDLLIDNEPTTAVITLDGKVTGVFSILEGFPTISSSAKTPRKPYNLPFVVPLANIGPPYEGIDFCTSILSWKDFRPTTGQNHGASKPHRRRRHNTRRQ